MYDMRRSVLRRYTCAALNGRAASTVPVTLGISFSDTLSRPCATALVPLLDATYPATTPATTAASARAWRARERRLDDGNMLEIFILCSTGQTGEPVDVRLRTAASMTGLMMPQSRLNSTGICL